jgi:GNAT superfamily N-acetyltransferase
MYVMHTPLLSDLSLARRLERAEGHANRAFVEARQRLEPAVGASWTDVDGCWAMFDGHVSPLTQTFGFGCFADPNHAQLDALEAFFTERGAPTFHEVATVIDPSTLGLLAERQYRPVEWSAVLCQRLDHVANATLNPAVTVRRVSTEEYGTWADVSARGWADQGEIADFIRQLAVVSAHADDNHAFLAENDGVAIAAGGLHLHEGVALLSGASTVPSARGQGAQHALLQARLAFAAAEGADLAMMAALPGSSSQRNAQRAGFTIAYSRVKWQRSLA